MKIVQPLMGDLALQRILPAAANAGLAPFQRKDLTAVQARTSTIGAIESIPLHRMDHALIFHSSQIEEVTIDVR